MRIFWIEDEAKASASCGFKKRQIHLRTLYTLSITGTLKRPPLP